MRIKIKGSKKFFKEILEKENCNLRKFAEIINVNYSTIKKYRRGDLLIPEELFEKIVHLSLNKGFWLKNTEKFDNNWGSSKGGKISILKDPENKRIAYARKFKSELKELKLPINESFCEFYGALLGDGCITNFTDLEGRKRSIIYITGNKELDSDYLIYLKEKLKKEFNINSYFYKYKNKNSCFISITNKSFSKFLQKVGFPVGKKYGKLKIPGEILKLGWRIQRAVIRGIFDTDGSICAKKREGYKYPQISLSSKDEFILNQIYNILRKKGYPCWICGSNLYIRSGEAVKKWFNDIGSSNNRNIFKYEYWLKNKILPPRILGS